MGGVLGSDTISESGVVGVALGKEWAWFNEDGVVRDFILLDLPPRPVPLVPPRPPLREDTPLAPLRE